MIVQSLRPIDCSVIEHWINLSGIDPNLVLSNQLLCLTQAFTVALSVTMLHLQG
ncbi:hypothetical protein CsSME_00010883 [Camellia sinensis var. sinensis]